MRVRVRDIEESAKELVCDEGLSELNPILEHGPVHDYRFADSLSVHLRYYRSGQELFFEGEAIGTVVGQCARCLEDYEFTVEPPFSFVMIPRARRWADDSVDDDDPDISCYEGDQVDLSPLLRERILLALPTLPLCHEGCRGLCARCGANLNSSGCDCRAPEGDPQLAVLRTLKVSH